MDNKNHPLPNKVRRILRRKEVEHLTGYSRSTIYLLMKQNKFPNRKTIGSGRAVGWDSIEIEQWIEEQLNNT